MASLIYKGQEIVKTDKLIVEMKYTAKKGMGRGNRRGKTKGI